MKKLFFSLLLLVLPLVAGAQTLKFGYLSYNQALKAMAGYVVAQKNLSDLQGKYDAEYKRSEEEFDQKYEEFLDGQRDFAPSILKKRQAELQNFIKRNVVFKKESQRLLQEAEMDAMKPLKAKLNEVIQKIAQQRGFAFVLNTDNDATPYVDPALGEDITAVVCDAVK